MQSKAFASKSPEGKTGWSDFQKGEKEAKITGYSLREAVQRSETGNLVAPENLSEVGRERGEGRWRGEKTT